MQFLRFKLPVFLFPKAEWLERKQNSILSAAVIITVANIISSLSGLLRQRLLIDYFFQSQSSREAFEALLVAFQIPDMMFQLIILGAISAAFIPIFTSLRKKDEKIAFQMASIIMNWLLLIFILVGILVFIFAEPLTAWRTGNAFTPEQIGIAARLTRIMLIAQLFFAISNFLSGILQSYQRFVLPSIAPVLYNVGIVIGTYLLAPQLGIYAAGVGVILGAFIHMAIQLPLAWKLGFKQKLSFNLKHPGIRDLVKMMPARLLTLSITELQNLALGFFATSLGNLSFVVMRLALTLMAIPIRLFGVPISQASLPFLSEESEHTDLEKYRDLVVQSLHQISFLALPASVLLLILRIPIVRLVFGSRDFPWETTVLTGRVVAIIAISIVAQAMAQLLIRAFHALKNTRIPLYITIVTVVLYLLICYLSIFVTNWGIMGMAIATALSAFIETFLLIFFMHRRIHAFADRTFWVPQLKMAAASFLMAVFLYLPFKILDELVFNTSRTLELIALTVCTTTIGLLVYIYFSALFEVKELQFLARLLSSFERWQKSLSKTREVLMETPVEGDEL